MKARKRDYVSVRITAAERKTIARAATMEKRTVSDFVRVAAVNTAVELIDSRQSNLREAQG